jgi:hypothetical protein
MRQKRPCRCTRVASLAAAAVLSAVVSGAMTQATAAGATPGDPTLSIAQASSATPGSKPQTITITGGSEETPAAEAVSLDGTYVVTAGGSRSAAVLGAVSFDPAGTVTGGTLSFITPGAGDGDGGGEDGDSQSAPTTTRTSTTAATASLATAATASSAGVGADASAAPAAAPADSAVVTDCSVGGGSYTLSETGAGEAQIQLTCADGSPTVTWRLFITATDGFTLAQQFRAVQLEPLSETADDGIIDLLLTLR